MTPIYRHFERFLPRPLAWVALTLAYTVMLGAVLLLEAPADEGIIYIDLRQ